MNNFFNDEEGGAGRQRGLTKIRDILKQFEDESDVNEEVKSMGDEISESKRTDNNQMNETMRSGINFMDMIEQSRKMLFDLKVIEDHRENQVGKLLKMAEQVE